jgi:hypothetical protein
VVGFQAETNGLSTSREQFWLLVQHMMRTYEASLLKMPSRLSKENISVRVVRVVNNYLEEKLTLNDTNYMPDFSKTKIYIIENTVDQPVCIGFTTNTLNKRWNNYLSEHNNKGRSDYKMNISGLMRDHGFDNFSMRLLEEYPCNNRCEAEAREGYYMKLYRDDYGVPITNTKIEGETNLVGQGHMSEYYRNNPASYKRYKARKRELIQCDKCGAMCSRRNIVRHQKTQGCQTSV